MALKIGALFAGYGGLDLAVKMVLPAQLAWVSEIEPAPTKILAHHFPDIPNHGDVTKIDWNKVEPVDIITGGSPCQDLSHAGRRAGMKTGTRSGLWASMCEAIETIKPRLVVWENVQGALSAEASIGDVESCDFCVDGTGGGNMRALGRVLGDLAEIGYHAAWTSLRAADVGAPHPRFRVFVLAWPAEDTDSEGWGAAGDTTPSEEVSGRASAEPGRPDRTPIEILLPTPAVNDMGAAYDPETWDQWTEKMKQAHGNGNGHGKSLSIETLRMLPTPTSSDSNGIGKHGTGALDLRTTVALLPTPTSERPDVRKSDAFREGRTNFFDVIEQDRWGEYAPAIARWETVFGRPAPDPTLPTGRDGKHQLSARFVEWMMGLPDGWVTSPTIGASRNNQLKALGNGVVPQQAAWAIRHLLGIRNQAIKEQP